MNNNLFNKLLIAIVSILLVFAIIIKIHSITTFPKINDWNYNQLKKIDHNKKNFSFAVFGDNKNSITTFDSLIQQVNNENVLFSIDVGDMVFEGDMEKYRFFIEQILKSKHPFLTVIGNHEIYDDGRGNYDVLFGRPYYSFSVGNSYFIVLDDANEKNIDGWQMDWLKNELEKSQNFKYIFLFMHVPLFDPRKGEYKMGHSLKDLNFARKLNTLFDNYRITMLFASHIHGYYRGYWDKTAYIITGGAGAELAGTNPQHYFYHYIKVDISDNGVKYKIVRLKSPDFEWFDRLTNDIWIYVYAYFSIKFWDVIIILIITYLVFYFIFFEKKWLLWNIGKKKR